MARPGELVFDPAEITVVENRVADRMFGSLPEEVTVKSAEPTVLIEQKMRSPQAFARRAGCGTQPTGEVIFGRNLRAYIPENSAFGGARSIPTAFGYYLVDDVTIIATRAQRSWFRTYNNFYFMRRVC